VTYPILAARLRALEDQLTVVEQSPRWLDAMSSGGSGAELRDGLDGTIGIEVRNQKEKLEKIRTALDNAGPEQTDEIRDAWSEYFRVQSHCETIFGECLRLLGGLAIRNQGFDGVLDNQTWDIADELVRGCANESVGDPWTSLTVPASREAVARTLARMVRLRFPAWDIWTIPLAAREYGHVVAEDAKGVHDAIDQRVRERVAAQLEDVVADEARVRKVRSKAGRQVLELTAQSTAMGHDLVAEDEANAAVQRRVSELVDRERGCLHLLVADAYATYTLGIAYACAALLLRFEPTRSPRDNLTSDAVRGEVVLAMLERMNEESRDRPYDQALERLRAGWESVLEYATTNGTPAASDPEQARAFVDWIWNVFRISLRLTARYPDEEEEEGWLSVRKARTEWQRTLNATDEFGTSALGLRKLRDALNAAWSWRLENPDADDRKLRRLETTTLKVCRDIVDDIRNPGEGDGRGAAQRAGDRSRG
jgi:hypothetical protein